PSSVLALLAELPAEQLDAVRAHIVEDESYVDAAARLRTSPSVVRKRVSRGLAVLRRRLTLAADGSGTTLLVNWLDETGAQEFVASHALTMPVLAHPLPGTRNAVQHRDDVRRLPFQLRQRLREQRDREVVLLGVRPLGQRRQPSGRLVIEGKVNLMSHAIRVPPIRGGSWEINGRPWTLRPPVDAAPSRYAAANCSSTASTSSSCVLGVTLDHVDDRAGPVDHERRAQGAEIFSPVHRHPPREGSVSSPT